MAVVYSSKEWDLVHEALLVLEPIKTLTAQLQDRSPIVMSSLFLGKLQSVLRTLQRFGERTEAAYPAMEQLSSEIKSFAALLVSKIQAVRSGSTALGSVLVSVDVVTSAQSFQIDSSNSASLLSLMTSFAAGCFTAIQGPS
jgi:hypothetical protein